MNNKKTESNRILKIINNYEKDFFLTSMLEFYESHDYIYYGILSYHFLLIIKLQEDFFENILNSELFRFFVLNQIL